MDTKTRDRIECEACFRTATRKDYRSDGKHLVCDEHSMTADKEFFQDISLKCDDKMICEDCQEETPRVGGRFYKYEPHIWLCEGCHADRMNDDDQGD